MGYSLRPGLARSADIRAADVVKCQPEKLRTIVLSEAAARELATAVTVPLVEKGNLQVTLSGK
jgi:hypothetical protein